MNLIKTYVYINIFRFFYQYGFIKKIKTINVFLDKDIIYLIILLLQSNRYKG